MGACVRACVRACPTNTNMHDYTTENLEHNVVFVDSI